MKKILSILMIAIILTGLFSQSVTAADEGEKTALAEVISQSEYGGYQLEWERREGALFDTLLKVTCGGEVIAEYEYNCDNNRISKSSQDGMASFTYTCDFYLDTVSDKHGTIQYLYCWKNDSNIKYMTGFLYNGAEYVFTYDGGLITGISCNGDEIAKYIYAFDYTFLQTMKKEGQEWIECEDEDFIGNINKIRFAQVYYDEETGWYYFGRYFDTENNRYLDGISSDIDITAENMDEEISLLSYCDTFLITGGNTQSRNQTAIIETISRVLYCEAGTSPYDWDAVAWVVYNRAVARSMNAYQVITEEGQFSAYYMVEENGKHPYENLDLNDWYNTAKWERCYDNASRMVPQVNPPSNSVPYINNQDYFARVETFIKHYRVDGNGKQYFDNRMIKNVAVPGVAQILASMSGDEIEDTYGFPKDRFNIYYEYE